MDAATRVPPPSNEPVLSYAPGTAERAEIVTELAAQVSAGPVDLLGRFETKRPGSGDRLEVRMPSDRSQVLGVLHQATAEDARQAVSTALAVAPDWAALDFDSRAAIFLKAADLLAGPYRARINAATMLGQGKTVQQAEIDSACELVDFLRFNVDFAQQIHADQPVSAPGVWNRADYRPLEGFVYAITPFNFTAIAGNLPTAPAIMGNVALWKPAPTQQLAASVFADVLAEAGLPDGVITMLPGHGYEVSDVALAHESLAGIHFTGSTAVFHMLWGQVGANLSRYRSYPRLVGETGGKDFVLAHPSADPEALRTALIRGAFEYSGQKCSAASRAYLPASLWRQLETPLVEQTEALSVGDVRDLTHFTSAVIDEKAFRRLADAIDRAKAEPGVRVVAGGSYDDSFGWFIRPTIIEVDDPGSEFLVTEFFGPLLAIYVYDDADWDSTLDLIDQTGRYALTGAVFAQDRFALTQATQRLRNAAGNFYLNDKPTGAVVGQQPFGGARASGTNDKAGSMWNLIRWSSPRSIKETLVPPTEVGYPHMSDGS